MKRLLTTLLALLYLAAGAGFTLREHYCMGAATGAEIEITGHADSHHCSRCGMDKKSGDNGCCKDKVKVFKASPDQTVAKAFYLASPMIAVLPPALFTFSYVAYVTGCTHTAAAPVHGPPLRSGLPLYLRLRCIRV